MKLFITSSLEPIPGKETKDYEFRTEKAAGRSWPTKPIAQGLVDQINIGGGKIPITMPSGERGIATNFRVEPRDDRFVISCELGCMGAT